MIDQPHATVRTCDKDPSRIFNAVPWPLFGIVSFVLVISGCSTSHGARSTSKPADKKSIVSKYLPKDQQVADEQVAATKAQPKQQKGLDDKSLSRADDGLIRPVRSVQSNKPQSTDSVTREDKTAEFTDLFNRGADDKSRNPRYDTD